MSQAKIEDTNFQNSLAVEVHLLLVDHIHSTF